MRHDIANPDVSRETLMQSKNLQKFAEIFQKWQKTINLTAANEDLWERHIAQSIALLNFCPQNISTLADFGTGGGFPGLILAIYWQEQFPHLPAPQFHLIESDARKASFLREAARLIGVNVTIHQCRIDNLDVQKFDVITARALAPLPKLINYSLKFMGKNSVCLFYKGENYQSELTAAKKQWNMNYKVIPLLQQKTFILQIKEIYHVK